MLWLVDPDLFPFKQMLVESHVSQLIHCILHVHVYMYVAPSLTLRPLRNPIVYHRTRIHRMFIYVHVYVGNHAP